MAQTVRRGRPKKSKAELLRVWGPLLAVVAVGFAIAVAKLEPPPPKALRLAAGSPGGAYHAYAERYREILARAGFDLEVIETAGSVENLERLEAGEVDLALVQGGTEGAVEGTGLESLASLFFEPVWLFFRTEEPVEQLTDLIGERIAVGPPGSGTRALAHRLLADNAVEAPPAELLSLASMEAAAALEADEIDAAIFVSSSDSELVRRLIGREDVELLSVRRSLAYRKAHPFLSRVVLGEGVLDLAHNLPAEDISLLAAAASLVASKELHHALVPLLLNVMTEVHGGEGIFTVYGEFPSAEYVGFPLRKEARHYLANGPSFLFRILGFRLATAIDRLKILLLPLITLLIPVARAAPPIYRWRIRSKIYRWYDDLRWIDESLHGEHSRDEVAARFEALEELEAEVAEVEVPLSYMDEYYSLRLHVQLIRDQLEERLAAG